MGLPVVASDVGALPEIVVNEKTGFLVPPNDSNQLAQALIRVLSDPTLASRIGAAGRLHAVTNFSWEATADVMSTGIKARIATALAP
jgi:glycosyltransferase involved in cell wall biosynthesis